MVKLPAGRTTISGQARQSRKTVPAARGAAFACATTCVETVKLQASARMMQKLFISGRSEIISKPPLRYPTVRRSYDRRRYSPVTCRAGRDWLWFSARGLANEAQPG